MSGESWAQQVEEKIIFCPVLRRYCECKYCAWRVDSGCAVAVIASELLRRREREEGE